MPAFFLWDMIPDPLIPAISYIIKQTNNVNHTVNWNREHDPIRIKAKVLFFFHGPPYK
jgi:hypothetical protein